MSTISNGTEILDQTECWELLEATSVGRLAVAIAGKPDIFPINYILDGNTILFRSGAGTKLAAAALLHDVAFEIDGYLPLERVAWSVVVKGRAHQVEKMAEVFAAQDLALFPWAAHPKPNYVRIDVVEMTGRRFHVLDDVVPDSSIGWQPVEGTSDAVKPKPGVEYHPGASKLRPG